MSALDVSGVWQKSQVTYTRYHSYICKSNCSLCVLCSTHYKTPPLRNLCLKLCHVYVTEWRPRQRLFFSLVTLSLNNFSRKKHSGCTLHSETRSGHVNLFCSVSKKGSHPATPKRTIWTYVISTTQC